VFLFAARGRGAAPVLLVTQLLLEDNSVSALGFSNKSSTDQFSAVSCQQHYRGDASFSIYTTTTILVVVALD
jgi:hypothetical protein